MARAFQKWWNPEKGDWDEAPVVCTDGNLRTPFRVKPADTWFSMPACVKVNNKTVSGYITPNTDTPGEFRFYAYRYRANADLLPPIATDERLKV